MEERRKRVRFVLGHAVVFALLTAACLLVGSCATVPPRPDPKPLVTSAEACQHMRDIGCREGAPTRRGATCEQVFDNAQASGVLVIDFPCMARAPDCTALQACFP